MLVRTPQAGQPLSLCRAPGDSRGVSAAAHNALPCVGAEEDGLWSLEDTLEARLSAWWL